MSRGETVKPYVKKLKLLLKAGRLRHENTGSKQHIIEDNPGLTVGASAKTFNAVIYSTELLKINGTSVMGFYAIESSTKLKFKAKFEKKRRTSNANSSIFFEC